jgi:hypothetical protein
VRQLLTGGVGDLLHGTGEVRLVTAVVEGDAEAAGAALREELEGTLALLHSP